MRNSITLFLTAATLTVAACGGDKKAEPDIKDNPNAAAVSPDAYRKAQQAFADSVLNAAKTSKDVVSKLGKDYEVGSVRMRDSLAVLANKTDCFPNGRKSDPYLAGTVSFFVYMSVVGSNTVRVQESTWTSQAGNIVDSCLNLASKNWKFDTTFGKPAGYITQVQFK